MIRCVLILYNLQSRQGLCNCMEWRDKWFYVLMYDMVFVIGERRPPILGLTHQDEGDFLRLCNDPWKCNTLRYESCWSLQENVIKEEGHLLSVDTIL